MNNISTGKGLPVLDAALAMVSELAAVHSYIASQDRILAHQLQLTACSVPENIAEANRRRGADRLHHYRLAAEHAAEARSALAGAAALSRIERGTIDPVLAKLDQIVDMLLSSSPSVPSI
jgi:four helix bundle protein